MKLINFDDETREGWCQFLDEFENDVYPTFAKYGYGRNSAIMTWMLNVLTNALSDTTEQL